MGQEIEKAPEVTLLKSELEAAAARVAERAMNTTLDGVTGVVGDIFGGWFGDGIKQWRTRRLVDQLIKTKQHLERHGIQIEKAKALPMAQALEIFEGASKQDDPDLGAMWAALLSNSMNPSDPTFIDPSFSKILSSLSGLDAQILNFIFEWRRAAEAFQDETQPIMEKIGAIEDSMSPEYIDLFSRQRAIKKRFDAKIDGMKKAITDVFSNENIVYSTSHLLRQDLIFLPVPRSSREDYEIALQVGHIQTIESDLRQELDTIWSRLSIASESGMRNVPLFDVSASKANRPQYRLTGFGERFLAACA